MPRENRPETGLPPMHDALLPRERLLGPLADAGCRVAVLHAEAGSGKTSLLATHVTRSDDPVVWLDLAPRHLDPIVFIRDWWTSLEDRLGDLPGEALAIATSSEGGERLGRALTLLGRTLGERRIQVILDDAHHLSETVLDTLVQDLPRAWRLILSSRRAPGGALVRRILQGDVLEWTTDDLRLTRPELGELARRRGLDLTEAELDALLTETSGWVMGTIWGLTRRGRRGLGPDALDRYLAHEVLDGLDPDTREHLLLVSHLPRLSRTTCERLLGPDAPRFLDGLTGAGGLVSTTGHALELVPCFRDFLRRTSLVRWSGDARREALMRVATLLDDPVETIRLWLEAGEIALAEEVFGAHLDRLFREGRLATVRSLLDGFPPDRRLASPLLSLAEGERFRREGQLDRALEALGRATANPLPPDLASDVHLCLAATHGARGQLELQLRHVRLGLESPRSEASRAFGLNVLGLHALATGDLEMARVAFHEAMTNYERAGDRPGQMRVMHNLGLTCAREGDFSRAVGCYMEALSVADHGQLVPLPMTLNNLALCQLHLGRLGEARDVLSRGLELCDQLDSPRERTFMRQTEGYLAIAEGRLTEADEAFARAETQAASIGDRHSRAHALLGMAEVALERADLEGAERHLHQALARVERDPEDAISLEGALLQVEFRLRRNQAAHALEEIAALETRIDHPRYRFQQFHLARLRMRAHAALSQSSEAQSLQRRIEDLKATWGYAERGTPVSDPLLQIGALGPLHVRIDGTEIPEERWKSDKAKVLLLYLVLFPEGGSKEGLLDLLFPEGPGARSALPMVVTRLRQALEPDMGRAEGSRYILHRQGRYVLNPAIRRELDVLAFRHAMARARKSHQPADRQALLEEALDGYRGGFLEDHQDVAWCTLEREKWRSLMLEGVEELLVLMGRADDWAGMQRIADRLLSLEPAADLGHRARIAALAMQDRPHEAMRACEVAVESMARLGGLEPDFVTGDLIESVREGSLSMRQVREAFESRWEG